MTENRRQYSRIQFQTDAQLHLEGASYEVEVLDLSLKGALLRPRTPLTLPPVTRAVLRVRLGEAGPSIRMVGQLAHHEAGHYGFACHDIDLDSITHLRRLVELNLGDAELLERELSHLTTG